MCKSINNKNESQNGFRDYGLPVQTNKAESINKTACLGHRGIQNRLNRVQYKRYLVSTIAMKKSACMSIN